MTLLSSLQPVPVGAPETWGARHAHDPTVVRDDDGTYYMFSTDAVANCGEIPAGVHVRTSPDLVEWAYCGTALDGVPAPAFAWSGAKGLWAPEVVRWPVPAGQTRWHMYYSASTFGSNTSAIGLAVAPTPSGPWTDQGLVVRTKAGRDTQNAIDAAVTFDSDGLPWLTYGSFFSGIHTLRLDAVTGHPVKEGSLGTCIARRPSSVDRAIEGAFVQYRGSSDKYILFASYDSLFNTYNVRVAIADAMTGPYRDATGAEMTDAETAPHMVGTKILGSYRFDGDTAWLAPGHNSILTVPTHDGEDQFMVHHVRFVEDPSQHVVQLRRVFFTAGGWPVVSPQPYAGPASERLDAPVPVSGTWRVLRFDPSSTDLVEAAPTSVHDDAAATSAGQPRQVRLAVGESVLDAVVFGSWDFSRNRRALSFSGIGADGVVYSGTQGA
ncbi:arabinan endo-1,5-alpha-L-arabinosidase [Arthrobacter pigmenti]|uniref:Arabinan endo-1,5-alpha-L-arabinosidase n=1 Tax=Arthrobacter pigmenti TaxID=271432 RepID=A0A846RE40_9MICC|nr:arabinan endo-1,5-alpha-L-arabinosidase [Arthrobacter pigmenti]NJC21388.1 arabinan endo-1,5-alpha-L-arabinosidase [Arthrobacter pigmenti]